MGYVAKTVYDKDNRVTEETDALGQKESYTYDKDSRVTSITDKRGFTTGFDSMHMGIFRLLQIRPD